MQRVEDIGLFKLSNGQDLLPAGRLRGFKLWDDESDSNQPHLPQAAMAIFADDEMVVHQNPKRLGDVDDRAEQLRAIELFPRILGAVHVRDLREEHPQHPEQEQRAHPDASLIRTRCSCIA